MQNETHQKQLVLDGLRALALQFLDQGNLVAKDIVEDLAVNHVSLGLTTECSCGSHCAICRGVLADGDEDEPCSCEHCDVCGGLHD